MELKSFFAQDKDGVAIPGASVYLYQKGTTTLATGIEDENGNALQNPFQADEDGLLQVAAPDGAYDLRVSSIGRDNTIRVQFLDTSQALQTIEASASQATTEADRAQSAADSAELNAGRFEDTASGISATNSGEYFSVPSSEGAEYLVLYKNNSGTADEVKRYPSTNGITKHLYELPDNQLPWDRDYPSALDMRSGSNVVDVPDSIPQLIQRGYEKCINWRSSGNEFARYSSGVDLNGQWVFGAFLIYSENPNNVDMNEASIFSEAPGGSLSSLSNPVFGKIDISSELKLIWRAGQVNSVGDENILLGYSEGPESGSSMYATGYTLVVQSTEPDSGSLIRNMMLRDSARHKLPELIDHRIAQNPGYNDFENRLAYGDYFGGSPETRSNSLVEEIPEGELRDLGYAKGINWANNGSLNNEYFRYRHDSDLAGKYVFWAFLAWSDNPANLPLTPASYTENDSGSLKSYVLKESGQEDLGGVFLHWGYGVTSGSVGYPNLIFGSTDAPADTYVSGAFVYLSDSLFNPSLVKSAYLLRQKVMSDSFRRVMSFNQVSTGQALLYLAGKGNIESHVESNLSGSKIKRTFVAFPDYQIDSYPVAFNFRKDIVNGTVVRSVSDDVAPDHVLGTTMGANHGWGLGVVQATSHGKTQDDQGSIWTDGVDEYILVWVKDADTLLMTRRDINTSNVPAGTYTHVSGAVNTGDIVTLSDSSYGQWYPPFNNRNIKLIVDGEEIAERTGTFAYRDSVQFIESYDVLGRSEIISWWEANGASGDIVPEGNPSYTVSITYEFDRDGQCTIYRDFLALESMDFSDMMGLQAGRDPAITEYYVPTSVEFTHDAEVVNYALKEPADRTSAGGLSSVNFYPSRAQASGLLVDRVISLAGSDYVFAMGFLPIADTSIANRRTQCSSNALEIRGNTDKLYMRVVDKGNLTLSPGDQFSTIAYRHILPGSLDRTDAYAVRTQGSDYFFVDWHDVQKFDRVPIPSDLAGRDFEIVESRNATLRNTVLTGSLAIDVAAVGDYAYLILKVL